MTANMVDFLLRHLHSTVAPALKGEVIFLPTQLLSYFLNPDWLKDQTNDNEIDLYYSFAGSEDRLFASNHATLVAHISNHFVLVTVVNASDLLTVVKLNGGKSDLPLATSCYITVGHGILSDFYNKEATMAVQRLITTNLLLFYGQKLSIEQVLAIRVINLYLPIQPGNTVSCGTRLYLHCQHGLQKRGCTVDGMQTHFNQLQFTEAEVIHVQLFLYWVVVQYCIAHIVGLQSSKGVLPKKHLISNLLDTASSAEFNFFKCLQTGQVQLNPCTVLPFKLPHSGGYYAGMLAGQFLLISKSFVAQQKNPASRSPKAKIFDQIPYLFDSKNTKLFGGARVDAIEVNQRIYVKHTALVLDSSKNECIATEFVLMMIVVQVCGNKQYYVMSKLNPKKIAIWNKTEIKPYKSDLSIVANHDLTILIEALHMFVL